jgi:mono/diheme cytochrome c family protein
MFTGMKKRNSKTRAMRCRNANNWLAIVALMMCAFLSVGRAVGQPVGESPDVSEDIVALGRYLATAANCESCHTASNGAPFAGGVAFSTPFGIIYSTNITQDVEAGIGNWTLEDFQTAMRKGTAPQGRRLFPAFPYPSFAKITDSDIQALYSFLRTVKPETARPPSNGILFSQRWAMVIWNWMFLKQGPLQHDAGRTNEWNRGAYLVEGLGHCGACHSPRNAMMAESEALKLSGGIIDDEVATGKIRRWSAVNLTPGRDGLAAWSTGDIEAYLKRGYSARAGTFGPMNKVIQNSTGKLSADDLHAIAVYLKGLSAISSQGIAVRDEEVNAGAHLYKKYCEECHGGSGRGGIFAGPPLAGSAVVQSDDPSSLINIILYGPNIPNNVKMGGWQSMKPYHEILDDADTAAIANFVRGSWGNRARSVSAGQVARQR